MGCQNTNAYGYLSVSGFVSLMQLFHQVLPTPSCPRVYPWLGLCSTVSYLLPHNHQSGEDLVHSLTLLRFYPTTSAVSEWFDKRRGLALGLVVSGASAGGILWPLVLNQLIDKIGINGRIVPLALSLLLSC